MVGGEAGRRDLSLLEWCLRELDHPAQSTTVSRTKFHAGAFVGWVFAPTGQGKRHGLRIREGSNEQTSFANGLSGTGSQKARTRWRVLDWGWPANSRSNSEPRCGRHWSTLPRRRYASRGEFWRSGSMSSTGSALRRGMRRRASCVCRVCVCR